MTEQLQAALDALNACQTADDVAALLRRHGVRASAPIEGEELRCFHCPLAVYFSVVGGLASAIVGTDFVGVGDDSFSLPDSAREFLRRADNRCYRDLEAA